MPNYEIVHDTVGPFPRRIELTNDDGSTSSKVDAKGKLIPRVVSRADLEGVDKASFAVWLKNGAIVETDAPLSTEEVPLSPTNGPQVPNSPAGQKAAAEAAPVATKPATTAPVVKQGGAPAAPAK